MFEIGASELLLIAVIAIVAIGPKDLPLALRTAGRWIAKVRKVSGHFRSGVETMIREAELEEMEKQWKAQNAEIMAAHPPGASAEDALVGQDPGTSYSEPLGADVPAKPAKPRKSKAKAKAEAEAEAD
jgi:sec-independent protein translocase protein TatB